MSSNNRILQLFWFFSCKQGMCNWYTKLEKTGPEDLPGGPVVKNPPSSAGDTSSISDPGTQIPRAVLRGNQTRKPQPLSPSALESTRYSDDVTCCSKDPTQPAGRQTLKIC